jgi:hypothetical protein
MFNRSHNSDWTWWVGLSKYTLRPFPNAALNGNFLEEYIWTAVVVFPDRVRPQKRAVWGTPGSAGFKRTDASFVPGNASIANCIFTCSLEILKKIKSFI